MGHFSHLQPTPLNPKIVAVMLQKHHSQLFCVGHISTRIDVPSRGSPSYAIWLHSFCMSLYIDGFAHISIDYEVSSCVCERERNKHCLRFRANVQALNCVWQIVARPSSPTNMFQSYNSDSDVWTIVQTGLQNTFQQRLLVWYVKVLLLTAVYFGGTSSRVRT